MDNNNQYSSITEQYTDQYYGSSAQNGEVRYSAPVIELGDSKDECESRAAHSSRGYALKGNKLVLGVLLGVIGCALIVLGINFIGNAVNRDNADKTTGSVELHVGHSPVTEVKITDSTEKLTYAQIAAKVRRAVVGITVYTDIYGWGSYTASQGTGFIISDDGYVVTNSHVIGDDDYAKYTVTVNVIDENGETVEKNAVVVGNDTRTDLAVLKFDASDMELVVCELGDSDALVLGDEVVAIGNPGGEQLAGSITNGIISGIDRVIEEGNGTSDNAMTYLQTNAAINPGNSGGPLLNMYGQVIGINSSKIVANGYEGLGFAIPMAQAKPIIEGLIENGSIERPILGVTLREVSEQMAQRYDVPMGLLVISITNPGLSAAGIEVNDIITECDGVSTTTVLELQSIIEKKAIGDKVTLKVFRLGEAKTFSVEVELISDAQPVLLQPTNNMFDYWP